MPKRLFTLPVLFFLAAQLNAQTWADDVACIVYSHCSKCHSPGNIAPFSLMNYQEAYDYRFGIISAVVTREMPPWKAEPDFGNHAGKRLLTDEEVALVEAWVNNGTPAGNLANAPAAPVFNSTEEIQNPDLRVQIPTYTVPNNLTNDLYRVFAVPVNLPDDKYIVGLEVIPGNRSAVHHVLVYHDSTGQALAQDAADPLPGYTAFGGIGVFGAKLIGAWVPGSGAEFFPNNMGMRLPQNTTIALQVHYPADASGKVDSTHINFRLSDGSLRELDINPVLNHVTNIDQPLSIPANQVKTFHEQYTVPTTVSVLAVSPHAHLLCTSMKAFAITFQGDTIPLVDIPEWDFHWQGAYRFQKPVRIPPFAKLHGFATYDNTENNPENPNSPPVTVNEGEGTTDEMMLFYFTYTPYQQGDENIIIDTSSHLPHHLGCETHTTISGVEDDPQHGLEFAIYPNPVGADLTVEQTSKQASWLRLFDFSGKMVFQTILASPSEKVDVSGLPTGIYAATLTGEDGSVHGTQRLVVLR